MIRWLALAGLPMAFAGCGGTQVREPFHQSVATGAAPSVRIDNSAGEVRVIGWQKHSIEIDAVKSASSTGALSNINIDVQTQGNTVRIATKYRGFSSSGVAYTISLPIGSSIAVNNATGAIHIDGVGGDVTAGTQTGQVDASIGRVTGRRAIVLSATTGSVKLSIDSNSDARVDATTTIGDVTSDFPSVGRSRQNVVGAGASGTIGGGTATIRLTTTTGAIALHRS